VRECYKEVDALAAMAVASIIASVLLAVPTETGDIMVDPAAEPRAPEVASSAVPGGRCDSGHTGYYWTVDDRFVGGESYAIYCDPAGCEECVGSWRPISVTIYLYWEYENSCALTVRSSVAGVDAEIPSCPLPGVIFCESEAKVVGPFNPPGLWAVNVPLPEDCAEIGEPFFAMLTFEDTCDELPSLAADLNSCENGKTWNDSGLGWRGICDGDFPGNLSIFATLECQGASGAREASWSAIKDAYRSDD
jgi:hypothetical protein